MFALKQGKSEIIIIKEKKDKIRKYFNPHGNESLKVF